jgi:hypothetical protein
MAGTLYDFVEGDTNSVIRVTITNKQTKTVIDLTSATIRLVFSIDSGPVKSPIMTIVSPSTNGIVEYQFVTGDLTPGTMTAAIEITFSDTTILSQLDSFKFNVRAKL